MAEHRTNALIAQRLDTRTRIFNHHQRDPRSLKFLAEQTADASVTHQQCVIAQIERDLLLVFNRFFNALVFDGFRFRQIFFQQREQQRVKHNRQNCPRQHQITAMFRQQSQRNPQTGENKGEFADLRQTDGNRQRGAFRMPEHLHQQECGNGFTEHDNRQRGDHGQRFTHQNHRVE
ncbi:hypothetical protein SRABI106_04120 [Rahnella aquatilis]|nr:hypothetical protein SRABI106_04120 [Rahnella aquatilis]